MQSLCGRFAEEELPFLQLRRSCQACWVRVFTGSSALGSPILLEANLHFCSLSRPDSLGLPRWRSVVTLWSVVGAFCGEGRGLFTCF